MQLKRLFVSLLIVILILSATALVASAKNEADVVFTVDYKATVNADGSLSAKPGDIVEVSVDLVENKGASKLEINVNYDETVFAPVVENGEKKVTINEELNFKAPSSYVLEDGDWYGVLFNEVGDAKVIYRSDLNNKEVYKDTGKVLTLYFVVKDDVECAPATFTVDGVATRWNAKTNANVVPTAEVTNRVYDLNVHAAAFEVTTKAPTCHESDADGDGKADGIGYTTHTCPVCGVSITAEIAKLEHTWVDTPAVPATCTATGKTAGQECSVCGAVNPQNAPMTVPMVPHQLEIIPAVEPTYSESGWTEGTKCTVCGNIITAPEEIPAKSLAWLWITIAVVVVVGAGGGALAYFLINKKKKK